MLTLNDGRSELWQWDTGRKLTVDAECSQVHFSNKVFGRSIDMPVIDGVVEIPDFILQTDKDLNVWAFVGTAENGYTKISKTFKVNKRNKPADYVFTPTEQTSLEEIKEKIEYLESIQDPDAIKNAVEDYLEQNPVEAPVQSVNGHTGEVKLTAEDVGAISQDDLQEATNEALAQAKASGEFDGQQGQKGDKGEPGPAGPAGADGQPGEPGADGKTPIKGTDYFTEADKQEIAEAAAGLVKVPEATMKPLTFTGAVNATYDGSEAVSVEIPVGGGSGGGSDRLIAKYVHTNNKVIKPTALDLATGVFTCANHGLTTGNEAIIVNDNGYHYIPFELLSTYMVSVGSLSVRVIDTDTFILRNGNNDITYPHEANTMVDVSKWHIEIPKKESLVIGGFSAESVEVRVSGFYWGTNNYSFSINPYSNGKEITCLFDEVLHKRLPFSNGSLICPFVSGRYYIGKEYELDLACLTPSNKLEDYTYLQKYPTYLDWNSRCNGKTARKTFPLIEHNNFTDLMVCMLNYGHGIRLANGFTVEVYRRG